MGTSVRAAAAALGCWIVLAAPGSGGSGTEAPERVQVRGLEFDLTLSRPRVRPGWVIVQFLNAGEDPHDLRMRRVGSDGGLVGTERGFGVIAPGAYDNLDSNLARGATYELWCSLSDHRERGMDAVLRTRRHRR